MLSALLHVLQEAGPGALDTGGVEEGSTKPSLLASSSGEATTKEASPKGNGSAVQPDKPQPYVPKKVRSFLAQTTLLLYPALLCQSPECCEQTHWHDANIAHAAVHACCYM